MEFFGLAVRLSKQCEIGAATSRPCACRSLNVGSFCLFPGFTEALLSYELRDLSAAWRAAEAAEGPGRGCQRRMLSSPQRSIPRAPHSPT